jgi:phage-related protein
MSTTDTPLEFVGTSREDLSEFPTKVKYSIGFALRTAQKGGKHPDAKPLKGFMGARAFSVPIESERGSSFLY